MTNLGTEPVELKAGEKIAQMIPVPVLTGTVEEVHTLEESARLGKGFGSSGRIKEGKVQGTASGFDSVSIEVGHACCFGDEVAGAVVAVYARVLFCCASHRKADGWGGGVPGSEGLSRSAQCVLDGHLLGVGIGYEVVHAWRARTATLCASCWIGAMKPLLHIGRRRTANCRHGATHTNAFCATDARPRSIIRRTAQKAFRIDEPDESRSDRTLK